MRWTHGQETRLFANGPALRDYGTGAEPLAESLRKLLRRGETGRGRSSGTSSRHVEARAPEELGGRQLYTGLACCGRHALTAPHMAHARCGRSLGGTSRSRKEGPGDPLDTSITGRPRLLSETRTHTAPHIR